MFIVLNATCTVDYSLAACQNVLEELTKAETRMFCLCALWLQPVASILNEQYHQEPHALSCEKHTATLHIGCLTT